MNANARLLALLAMLVACRGAVTMRAGAEDFTFGKQTLHVAEGYTVQRVAGPPLVDRPITMAFDETGALYVSDSSGSNEKPAVQVEKPTHRILRLVDRDGDGIYDTKTVFADKLSFPEGTMWLDGSLYVAAPPQIWKFTDTDGDGLADQRTIWYDGKTLTGCANDLHGPYAGRDGFIYWCKGAFAEQHHTLADGREFVTRASHVFRMRPDGTGLDVVMTGGMDNPVDVAWSDTGEMFVSGTFFVNPSKGQRDGILHAVHGGVWGKEHAVLDGHPRTGPLMPIMVPLGPAAACGLEMPRSEALGLRGDLACCEFNLHKVSRHVLAADGATFKSEDSDLLSCDDADFHPTDVVEDADGSLLVADTGGWYRICCPTSTIAKPEVLGAIYRLRKKDAPAVEDARGQKIAWGTLAPAKLVPLLGDARPAVVDRAMAELARRGKPADLDAAAKLEPAGRRAALWTLLRMPGDEARAAIRRALKDEDADVCTLAAHGVSLGRDRAAYDALLPLLDDADGSLRRAAAEALGRIGDRRAIPYLLKAAEGANGRFLQHAITYALYEIGDADSLPTDAPGVPGELARTARKMITSPSKVVAMKPLPLAPPAATPPPDPAILAAEKARLDSLAAHFKKADAKRGSEVFHSAKALCTTCHAMGGVGGTLGPDLTKIGAIRTERDLLEAIVYPSASFVRSFEPMLVRTAQGEQYGILKKDAPDEVVLATGPGAEAHVPRGDVQEVQPGTASLMPAGFDGILTPQELADLVTFLRTAK